MNRILVDTSVWIDFLDERGGGAGALSGLLENDLVCTNDLILAELRPFLLHAGQAREATLLESVFRHELEVDWARITRLQVMNLRHGINRVGIPDLIIADHAICLRLPLYTLDKHFRLMKKHAPLELFEP